MILRSPIFWTSSFHLEFFFFVVSLRCLTGHKSRLDNVKQRLYLVLYGIYNNIKVKYISILWEEFTTYINHTKKATKITSARFWSLILAKAYEQVGIVIHGDGEVDTFSTLHIPKVMINQTKFPYIYQIPETVLHVVSRPGPILLAYTTSITVPYHVRYIEDVVGISHKIGKKKHQYAQIPKSPSNKISKGVVIRETVVNEPPQKKRKDNVLQTFLCKKKKLKPLPRRLKRWLLSQTMMMMRKQIHISIFTLNRQIIVWRPMQIMLNNVFLRYMCRILLLLILFHHKGLPLSNLMQKRHVIWISLRTHLMFTHI